MRRVHLYAILAAVSLLPQALAASRLFSWLAARPQALASLRFALPLLIALLNLPLVSELSRRRASPLLRALAAPLYPFFTAWWLGSLFLALLSLAALPVLWLSRLLGADARGLPAWLQLLPFLFSTYGAFLGSSLLRHDRVRVPIALMPRELRGLKILQLSDLHSGRHVSARRLTRIARRAARLKPDLVVVTGDIVHDQTGYAAQAARALGSIKPRLGVYACLGNHDFWAGADAVEAALEKEGVIVLRNRGLLVAPSLWLCGVDDPWSGQLDLPAALAGKPRGAVTLLLSHQPNTWPLARKLGVELQLSGHTHGGQIAATWLHRSLSLARLITPFVAGLYRKGPHLLYVNRGAGSVVPMVRLGARPELTEIAFVDARALRGTGQAEQGAGREELPGVQEAEDELAALGSRSPG